LPYAVGFCSKRERFPFLNAARRVTFLEVFSPTWRRRDVGCFLNRWTRMIKFRSHLLPWEYGVRNLLRRPSRSALTLGALAIVVLLIFVVVGFIRGLEDSLAVSGDPQVVLVYSLGAEASIENSAIAARI